MLHVPLACLSASLLAPHPVFGHVILCGRCRELAMCGMFPKANLAHAVHRLMPCVFVIPLAEAAAVARVLAMAFVRAPFLVACDALYRQAGDCVCVIWRLANAMFFRIPAAPISRGRWVHERSMCWSLVLNSKVWTWRFAFFVGYA